MEFQAFLCTERPPDTQFFLRYAALRCVGLRDTQFLIGSKVPQDARVKEH